MGLMPHRPDRRLPGGRPCARQRRAPPAAPTAQGRGSGRAGHADRLARHGRPRIRPPPHPLRRAADRPRRQRPRLQQPPRPGAAPSTAMKPCFDAGRAGSITRVPGIEAGHFTETRRPTGFTVVIASEGAVAGVDVRGAAPRTRETALLPPPHLVDKVHAIRLAGGSAWGLDAATGVMNWLEEQGKGLDVGVGRLPLVPAAVLFDLQVGDMRIRPGAAAGHAACADASSEDLPQGNVGAGAGATIGKVFGMQYAMKGGIGSASITIDGVTVGALIACNALGDVIDPDTARVIAGARSADGLRLP